MTKLVLMSRDYDMSHLVPPILRAAPELDVVLHGAQSPCDAEVAVCWNPAAGALASLPNLRLVHSIAAAVDNILSDPALPAVPLCRVVDPQHARGMSEFVTWGVLHYHRQLDRVMANQQQARWFRHDQRATSACAVGIMGLGEIGSRVATDLQKLGFAVRGWARNPRVLPGVDTYALQESLKAFLQGTHILDLPAAANRRDTRRPERHHLRTSTGRRETHPRRARRASRARRSDAWGKCAS